MQPCNKNYFVNKFFAIQFFDMTENLSRKILYIRPYTFCIENIIDEIRSLYKKLSLFGKIVLIKVSENLCHVVYEESESLDNCLKYSRLLVNNGEIIILKRSLIKNLDLTGVKVYDYRKKIKNNETKIIKSDCDLVDFWKMVLGYKELEKNIKKDYCKICFLKSYNVKIKNCKCLDSHTCIDCLIELYKNENTKCPFCRTFFDMFNLEYIND